MIFILFVLTKQRKNLKIEEKNYSLSFLENGEFCNKTTILEEGFICCNSIPCNKYCYIEEEEEFCISPKKVWFCFQDGQDLFLLMNYSVIIIFYIIDNVVRIVYYREAEHLLLIFLIFLIEFGKDMYFSNLIIFYYCRDVHGHKYYSYFLGFIYLLIAIHFFIFITTAICFRKSEKAVLKMFVYLPTTFKIQIILKFIIQIFAALFNCFLIMDFFMFIFFKYYRENCMTRHKNN